LRRADSVRTHCGKPGSGLAASRDKDNLAPIQEAAINGTNDEVGVGRSAHMRRLRRVDVVVFDCDSTLSSIEGIDELARDHEAEVSALTEAAMRGEVALEEVYGQRLSLVQPDRSSVAALGTQYVERVVPDALATIRALQGEGIQVRIMSGGLRPAVEHFATHLGIPCNYVAAVDVYFDGAGAYAGFDAASPLARAGGKRKLLEVWRRELRGALMFVGDGATDLETRDVADVFVAYAGVVERSAVVAAADIVIRSQSLAPVVPLALGGRRPRQASAQQLYDTGLGLLESVYRSYLSNETA
jgi:phosphoserine phosphatase